MADKTRNININYNLRTVGVDQARAAVASVDQATRNLQQSAPVTGQRISSAFQQGTQSILSMQNQLARLKSQIEVSTNPAKIAQLSAQYKTLKAQIDSTNKSLFEQSKAVKEVTANTKSLTSGFSGLYSAIKTVLAAGIAKEVADIAISAAKLSGQVEGVTIAFKKLPSSTLLLENLRDSTHGTLSDLELMQQALRAQNFGIPVKNLGTYLEFAAIRAQQTGESVDYMVNSIITGLGRDSIKILDNLQVDIGKMKDRMKEAGLTIDEAFTEQVLIQMQKAGGYIETAATAADKLTREIKELRVQAAQTSEPLNVFIVQRLTEAAKGGEYLLKIFQEIGNEIEQAGASAFFNNLPLIIGIRTALGDQTAASKVAAQEAAKQQALLDVAFFRQSQLTDEITKNRQKAFDIVQQEINSQVQIIGRNNDEIDQIKEKVKLFTDYLRLQSTEEERVKSLAAFNDRVNAIAKQENISRKEAKKIFLDQIEDQKKAIPFYEFQNLRTNEYVRLLKESRKEFVELNDEQEKELGIIEEKKKQIESLQDAIDKTRNSSDLSSRLQVGKLITDLAVAQAELKELLEGAANIEFKVKFEVEKLKLPEDKSKVLKDFEKEVEDLLKSVATIPIPVPVKIVPITPTTFGDQLLEEVQKNQENIISSGFDILSDQLKATEEIEIASLQNRLNNLRNYYDEQEILAGDNERAKAELRLKEERETAILQKKIAEKERQARRFSIIIDTATGIMRAFATLPTPAAIVQSAIIAALGASQLSIVSRTPARFKKGGYTGNAGVDDEVGIVHGQEYVTPAQQTKKSFGLLEAIKENRIDDRILRNLQLSENGVKVVPWNNKPVVDAINGNKPPDIITIGRQMYKVFKDRDGNKRYIRSKSM